MSYIAAGEVGRCGGRSPNGGGCRCGCRKPLALGESYVAPEEGEQEQPPAPPRPRLAAWNRGGARRVFPGREIWEGVGHVPTPSLDDVVRRSLAALAEQDRLGLPLGPEPTRRLNCLLRRIGPAVDDRYVNGMSSLVWGAIQPLSATQLGLLTDNHIRMDLLNPEFAPDRTGRQFLEALQRLDSRIFSGLAYVRRHLATHGAASNPAKVQLNGWIAGRQRDPNSVYHCYGGGG